MPGAALHFIGFPGIPEGPRPLPGDGRPLTAARLLADACPLPGEEATDLPHRFLRLHRQASPVPADVADGSLDYRYELRFHPQRRQPLGIEVWRCYAGGLGWQRRCGPMTLQAFLHRFLWTS